MECGDSSPLSIRLCYRKRRFTPTMPSENYVFVMRWVNIFSSCRASRGNKAAMNRHTPKKELSQTQIVRGPRLFAFSSAKRQH